jgi:hypothetical protein
MSKERKIFPEKIIGVIKFPRETFSYIEDGDLWRGMLLILVLVVLSSWAGMIYATKTEFDLTQFEVMLGPATIEREAIKARMIPFIAIGNGIGVIIRWLIPTILIILMAKILVGGGNSKRMFAMTGFASIPLIIQQVLRILDAYMISVKEVAVLTASRIPATTLPLRILNQTLNIFNIFGILTLILTVFAVSANYEAKISKAGAVVLSAHIIYIMLFSLF